MKCVVCQDQGSGMSPKIPLFLLTHVGAYNMKKNDYHFIIIYLEDLEMIFKYQGLRQTYPFSSRRELERERRINISV